VTVPLLSLVLLSWNRFASPLPLAEDPPSPTQADAEKPDTGLQAGATGRATNPKSTMKKLLFLPCLMALLSAVDRHDPLTPSHTAIQPS